MATETIWYPEEHTVAMAAILQEGLTACCWPEELAEVLEPQIEAMLAYAERMSKEEEAADHVPSLEAFADDQSPAAQRWRNRKKD